MAQMKILDNISADHLSELQAMAKDADEIILASPFLSKNVTSLIESVVKPCAIKKITLVTVLEKFDQGLTKPDILYNFIECCENNGIEREILIDEALHSKVYLFCKDNQPSQAILTSANFTSNGLKVNHEMGVVISESEALHHLMRVITKDTRSISKDDVLKLQHGAREYIKTHKIPQNNKINFNPWNLLDATGDASQVYVERQYFLKPCGWAENPYVQHEPLGEQLHFSKRGKPKVNKGDILICYAVGPTKLLGYYEIVSDELGYTSDDDRWPWYVKSECLSPKYSNSWWNEDLKIKGVAESYMAQYPNDALTYNGGFTLGALQWGIDKIRLNTKFAEYLIDEINRVS